MVTELYYPEDTSTGYVMTTIAEGLAAAATVRVVCAQPTYSQRGTTAQSRETHNRVEIRRSKSTTFDNGNLLGRLVNLVSATIGLSLQAAAQVRPDQVVVVVTNPPTLPYLVTLVARLRGARTVLLIHDLFPEILEVGETPRKLVGLATKPLYAASKWLIRTVDGVVVLGPDQAELVSAKLKYPHQTGIHTIPLAFDTQLERPVARESGEFTSTIRHRSADTCVFQFAGNIGPLQGIDFLVKAISLALVPDAHFWFVGAGRSQSALKHSVTVGAMSNVTLSDRVPRVDTADLHAACDVVLISLVEGMRGISVPSRIANALAAGRPILAVTDSGSTLDRLIAQHDIGWSIRPGDLDGFWQAVEAATTCPGRRREMGLAARALAESEYKRCQMIEAYVKVLVRRRGSL